MIIQMLEDGRLVKNEESVSRFDYECDVLVVGAGSA